ncbi:malto-oligosyltrehalose synthase [Robbsia andropogonis]|uniref:malto-oligosyltrehalose synthase n=1 Tax=Robbsia andropogonis TaxID=28092 RepID=UPI00046666B3|nr:malto-oligosyltrehalose synthase [Robbsia andropogonis]
MTRPLATLRLQFHKDFTFADALRHVDYFAALGISHLYASPITTAQPGSTHGYDTVDYTRVNPELGGEDGLRALVAALRERNMGLIADIVPNHMGVGGSANAWWRDILEWGRHAAHARFFDVDWHSPDPALRGKVLAPFLGESYGDALNSGKVSVVLQADEGRFYIAYYDHRFPVCPVDYPMVLSQTTSTSLQAVTARFAGLTSQPEDHIRAAAAQQGLASYAMTSEGRQSIDAALQAFHVPAEAESDDTSSAVDGGAGSAAVAKRVAARDALHRLLERQHYRLASWRTASDEVNWRRFFDISSLAGMRMERGDVFDAAHAMILRLYAEGLIDGVRIDHVDGMAEPREYCHRLRTRLEAARAERPAALRDAPPYLVVEKILARGEPMRVDWRIDGTTGYDFMNDVGALLHDPAGAAPLATVWASLSGRPANFAEEALPARRKILAENLAAELDRAARALHRIARDTPQTRDWPLISIRRVLTELVVHYGVYRIYPVEGQRSAVDEPYFVAAREAARASLRRGDHLLLDQIDQWLGGPAPSRSISDDTAAAPRASAAARATRADRNEEARAAQRRLALTLFSQLTSPVAAKSVEDTGCYRYGRLLSRNEVGADPDDFSMSVEAFHASNSERQQRFPNAMLTTATHDHKRGEDVRARLAVLSEMPESWARTCRRWSMLNAPHASGAVTGKGSDTRTTPAPGPGPEAMLYQTLVGCWPSTLDPDNADAVAELAERVARWQEKALREAKLETDWFAPNSAYEAASRAFLMEILAPHRREGFLAQLHGFVERIAPAGVINSLQQTVLRLTSPGVPDLYQGTESWDWSLVDPDNRRPVDYPEHAAALAGMHAQAGDGVEEGSRATLCDTLLAQWRDGRVKQWIIHRLLALRQQSPGLFTRGDYMPLRVEGPHARSIIAFARHMPTSNHTNGAAIRAQWSITVATRLATGLLGIETSGDDDVLTVSDAARLPRVAPSVWEDTRIVLPAALSNVVLQDIFTQVRVIVPSAEEDINATRGIAETETALIGADSTSAATEHAVETTGNLAAGSAGNERGSSISLPVAALLAHLPVAVLADIV